LPVKSTGPALLNGFFDGSLKDAPGIQNPQSQIDAGAGESNLPATIPDRLHDVLLGSVMFFFPLSSGAAGNTIHQDQEKRLLTESGNKKTRSIDRVFLSRNSCGNQAIALIAADRRLL
jgi:hypothetical protein